MNSAPTTSIDNPANVLHLIPNRLGKVLDCSSGYSVRAATYLERGATEIVGVRRGDEGDDPGTEGVSAVLVGNWMKLAPAYANGHFDCIVCDDVVARLLDPLPMLIRLAKLLSPSGLFIVTAPNLQYYRNVLDLVQAEWVYRERGAITRAHLRFFTGFELTQVLLTAGLHCERLTATIMDQPENFPLDETGHVQQGRIRIGPLTNDEYQNFLVDTYAVLATRAPGA